MPEECTEPIIFLTVAPEAAVTGCQGLSDRIRVRIIVFRCERLLRERGDAERCAPQSWLYGKQDGEDQSTRVEYAARDCRILFLRKMTVIDFNRA